MKIKRCCTCKMDVPVDRFGKDKTKKDGLNIRCRPCAADVYRKWKEADPERARGYWRYASNKYAQTSRYGITQQELDTRREQQGYCCAICGVHETKVVGRNPGKLVIDHCHDSSAVRGLLCHHCNTGLGFFRDDPDLLAEAATYLRESTSQGQAPVG